MYFYHFKLKSLTFDFCTFKLEKHFKVEIDKSERYANFFEDNQLLIIDLFILYLDIFLQLFLTINALLYSTESYNIFNDHSFNE